ncbi:hypothetical protein OC835_001261 [Tilletia horrida]|nr:hypothetical protein OC835_001261 [Tilletia horrida]
MTAGPSTSTASVQDSSSKHEVFAQANLDFFAKIAQEYDNGAEGDKQFGQKVRAMAQSNYAAVLRAAEWDPERTEMMDFACGTGMTTLLLAPHCKSVVGVDQSEPMLRNFRAKLDNAAEPSIAALRSKVEIVHTDLLAPTAPEDAEAEALLKDKKFDIVLCTMSYHHFAEPDKVTEVLARYLKPEGKLVIVDLLDVKKGQGEEGDAAQQHHAHAHSHSHGHGHGHHGHQHHAHAHGDASNTTHDPTEAQFNTHRAAHVIAHSSFVLSDFDRFFAGAGLERVGGQEPIFSAELDWPGARRVQDVYVVVGGWRQEQAAAA